MFFELQLSADIFTRIIRNRLRAEKICPDREFAYKDGSTIVPLVVDRVEIGGDTKLQREQRVKKDSKAAGQQEWESSASHHAWIFSTKNYTSFPVPYLQVSQEVLIHLVKAADLDANGPHASPPFKTVTVYAIFNVALSAAGPPGVGGQRRRRVR